MCSYLKFNKSPSRVRLASIPTFPLADHLKTCANDDFRLRIPSASLSIPSRVARSFCAGQTCAGVGGLDDGFRWYVTGAPDPFTDLLIRLVDQVRLLVYIPSLPICTPSLLHVSPLRAILAKDPPHALTRFSHLAKTLPSRQVFTRVPRSTQRRTIRGGVSKVCANSSRR